jgi:uncharacterized protein
MTQPAKSQEPSMEEILASIRRIIADDDASKSTPPEAPKAAAPAARPVPPPASRPATAPPRDAVPEPSPIEPEPEPQEAIADDSGAVAEADVEDQSADILDLTESMAAPTPPDPAPGPAPEFRKIDGSSDVGFDEVAEAQRNPVDRGRLLSTTTSAAVDSAFNSLAQTVLVQNARTLEDLVREMLRPMLKGWLDDNLPGMVERLVRAEIERVSRGR